MTNIRVIIFDFDGIIAESLNVKTQAFAELYHEYGKEIEQKVIDHHLANGGMSRYEKFKFYHNNFLDLEIDDQKVKSLAAKFSNLVLEKVSNAPYVLGADDFLKKNHKKYDFFISTGTPTEEIKIILKKRQIENYFIDVFGSPELKTDHVKYIMNKYGYKNSEVVFIGDATADRDAARANNIVFIGRYTTNEEILKEKYQINNLKNLDKILREL